MTLLHHEYLDRRAAIKLAAGACLGGFAHARADAPAVTGHVEGLPDAVPAGAAVLAAARDGFRVSTSLANAARGSRARLAADPASARLLLPDGRPPAAGETLRNPDLAALLERLAKAGSANALYRGEIADRIAAAFKAN